MNFELMARGGEGAANPRTHYYRNVRRKGTENIIFPLWNE
jgi:hypothetical protein